MLPKLSERAAMRCESHILRYFPAWKQTRIRKSGEGLAEMESFISHNKNHLRDLRNRIAEGETPCIDRGWPVLGLEPAPAEEPAEDPDLIIPHPAESMLDQLETAKAGIDERPPAHEEPPAEIAGFFEGKPHGMAAAELLQKINDLANLIHLKLATREQYDEHTVLSRHAPYLRSKAVEVV